MVRRGAKVIKICSTGGVLSLDDQPEDTQFSPAELKAIVDEAARSSRVVASHAIGRNGIVAALEAGVKSIEHGSASYLKSPILASFSPRPSKWLSSSSVRPRNIRKRRVKIQFSAVTEMSIAAAMRDGDMKR